MRARVWSVDLHIERPPAVDAGVPVVLLPALCFTSSSFARVTATLEPCRARVRVDLPGLGRERSRRPVRAADVLEALDGALASLGAPVVLGGHSLGGTVALLLAARQPERVAALVLMDAPVAPFPLSWWQRLASHPFTWSRALDHFGASAVRRFAMPRIVHRAAAVDEAQLTQLVELLCDATRRATLLEYHAQFTSPRALVAAEAALASIRCPVLALWGAEDRVVPRRMLETLERGLPPSTARTVRVFDGVGHLLPLEAPHKTAEAIDGFLRDGEGDIRRR